MPSARPFTNNSRRRAALTLRHWCLPPLAERRLLSSNYRHLHPHSCTTKISVMKCALLYPAVVHSHHSLSPFHSPFTGANHCAFLYMAQVISKVVSLYQGAFVGIVRAPVAACCRCCRRHRHHKTGLWRLRYIFLTKHTKKNTMGDYTAASAVNGAAEMN